VKNLELTVERVARTNATLSCENQHLKRLISLMEPDTSDQRTEHGLAENLPFPFPFPYSGCRPSLAVTSDVDNNLETTIDFNFDDEQLALFSVPTLNKT
jgi:hypothetical protein